MTLSARISPQRAQTLISEQLAAPTASKPAALGETLVRLGRLGDAEADRILAEQRKRGGSFGRLAVKLGLAKKSDIEYALGVQLGFLHETQDHVAIPEALVVARNPYSDAAEEFRAMRTRFLTRKNEKETKQFAVTGASETAGAEYLALNLAASFAQLGRKVLLVDANLRRPTLAKIFGDASAPGLADIAAGSASHEGAINATLVKNLDLLPAGAAAIDPQAILGGDAFERIINRAAGEFETVILVSAPFGRYADCEYVWSVAGKALIVARKDETRATDLMRIKSVMRQSGAEILGAAMTA